MKTNLHFSSRGDRRSIGGFTLAEMSISAAIFLIIFVAGMVSIQIFGMRIMILGQTKLSATTDAREAMNVIRDGIRAANLVYVGNYNPTNGQGFTQAAINTAQMGNALEVVYTNSFDKTNIFYQDATQPTNLLCSVSNGVVVLLAKYVTNQTCFYAEDYRTNILFNYQNNPVIHVVLNFSQWEFPIAYIGSGTNGTAANAYDYYRLQTRICRRPK